MEMQGIINNKYILCATYNTTRLVEWCGVQQGDGGGKEAGPESTGSGPNAYIYLLLDESHCINGTVSYSITRDVIWKYHHLEGLEAAPTLVLDLNIA